MIIEYDKIKNFDTSFYKKNFKYDETHHLARQVGEHYKLLAYLSHLYDDILILDVGTCWGESAVALSQNSKNRVITYDIHNLYTKEGEYAGKIEESYMPFLDTYSNLELKIMDISNESDDLIKSAKIIFLDIAHDGIQEKNFTDRLDKIGYKGYVFCDDIFCPYYPTMTPWWNSLTIEKYDLTEVGHSWGTGLLNYYQDKNVQIIK